MTDHLDVLMRSVEDFLQTADGVWGDRVHPDRAPAKKVRPYIVYFLVSDNDLGQIIDIDPMVVLTVKCVAADRQTAFLGAAEISALLDNKGEQELAAGESGPTGDADWQIATISQDRGIWNTEYLKGTNAVYHRGYQYEFVLSLR